MGERGSGWRSWTILVGGSLIALSSFAHAFAGWPPLRETLAAPRLVGLAYVAFGTTFSIARGPNAHFVGFIVLGLLVGLPALGTARSTRA